MKTRTKKIILIALAGTMFLGAISGGIAAAFSNIDVQEADAGSRYPITDPSVYYSGININSSTLLKDLNSLNKSKRKTTVGYKPMLNDPENGFYVTDPGSRSGSTITTFYSGKSNNGTGGLNREHVWPDSRGGNKVEADIHMPRPTLTAENGSRGNSFYVEGKKSPSAGWDPAMESFGLESYRGDSARIIFYCAIADTALTLVDKENDNQNNNTMGKLSDLLKWNLKYPVLERERVRNDGAESLQGNRNPFIDHPEYACKIWGNTNSATKQICAGSTPVTTQLERLEVTKNPTNTSYKVGEYFNPDGAVITAIYSDGSTKNVTSAVAWENKALTATTTSISCSYSDGGITKTVSIAIKVTKPEEIVKVTGISMVNQEITLKVGETVRALANVIPSNATNKSIKWELDARDEMVISLESETGAIKGLEVGTQRIIATTVDGNFSADCLVTVEDDGGEEEEIDSKLIEMAIARPPFKTVYFPNEAFDSTGLIVEGHYKNGQSKELVEGVDYKIVKPKLENVGTVTLKIRCLVEDDVPVLELPLQVVENEVTSFEITKNPAKTEYFKDDEVLSCGIEVKGICSDGSKIDISDLVEITADFVGGNHRLVVSFGTFEPQYINVTYHDEEPELENKAQDYVYIFDDMVSLEVEPGKVEKDDWISLEYQFSKLDSETKEYYRTLNNQSANEASAGNDEVGAEVVAKYDKIILENDNLTDFMHRNPTASPEEVDVAKIALIIAIVIVSIIALILIIVLPIKAHKRKKAMRV